MHDKFMTEYQRSGLYMTKHIKLGYRLLFYFYDIIFYKISSPCIHILWCKHDNHYFHISTFAWHTFNQNIVMIFTPLEFIRIKEILKIWFRI